MGAAGSNGTLSPDCPLLGRGNNGLIQDSRLGFSLPDPKGQNCFARFPVVSAANART